MLPSPRWQIHLQWVRWSIIYCIDIIHESSDMWIYQKLLPRLPILLRSLRQHGLVQFPPAARLVTLLAIRKKRPRSAVATTKKLPRLQRVMIWPCNVPFAQRRLGPLASLITREKAQINSRRGQHFSESLTQVFPHFLFSLTVPWFVPWIVALPHPL